MAQKQISQKSSGVSGNVSLADIEAAGGSFSLLERLVKDELKPPLTAEKFHEFLQYKYFNEENFEFLRETYKLESDPKDAQAVEDRLKNLLVKYIREDAEKSVNISSNSRKVLLTELEREKKPAEDTELKTLFAPSKGEVRTALIQGGFIKSFIDFYSTNINTNEATQRYIVSSIALMVAIGILFVLPYEARVVQVIPFLISASYFFSGYFKI